MDLFSEIFHSGEVAQLFSEKNTLAQMLRIEAALAKAQAAEGLFEKKHANVITQQCKVGNLNLEELKIGIQLGGNAVIPLAKQLAAIVKKQDPESAKYVHLGATSQDIVDTTTVLQIRDFLFWLDGKLNKLEKLLLGLTRLHRNTVMVGRTLLQQAKPITFGLKTAGWFESINRSRLRLAETKKRILVIQLAGAVGSGNEHITKNVQLQFAKILGLKTAASWHAHRDNMAEIAAVLGILAGSLGKIAKDVSLLMQTEIGEVLEGAAPGKGGSSTMPHKRNPVTCAAILANVHRIPFLVATIMGAMPQENERSAGLWHSEWSVLEQIAQLTAGAVECTVDLLEHLETNEQRMLQNIEATQGLIYAESVTLALASSLGKATAHELIEMACKTAILHKKHLKSVLLDMQLPLSEQDINRLFNPENSIGNSLEIIDDLLQKYDA